MTAEEALEGAILVYKTLGSQIKELEEQQKAAKLTISDIFTELGIDKAETPSGKAYITTPSVTVTYDAKGLDALCKSSDEIARLLTPHRRETERAGTLTIR